ncbi:MAG TPA: hypothetical protein VMU55_08965 [Solirubrobacteraceae bacterium]|nr:hypothetical protein [Solirubrobacteraceae bacterium]
MKPIRVVLPRSSEQAGALRAAIRALGDAAAVEFFHALDLWAATVEDGREALGVLNRRYDLCRLECGAPAPWIVAAYDRQREELVLATLLPDRRALDCPTHAQHCARALGEAVESLECYEDD